MTKPIDHADELCDQLRQLHVAVRDAVIRARQRHTDLADPVRHAAGDVVFRLDAEVEPMVVEHARNWAREFPLVLIAEGLGDDGVAIFPDGAAESDAVLRVIVDPIDGTRGLMYDKRSAWCLTGIAPNRGPETRLRDVQIAMMSELPTAKQSRVDRVWAVRGQGGRAERETLGGPTEPIELRPSAATSLDQGFASVAAFFPATKALAADLMHAVATQLCRPEWINDPPVFDDQYISTGGQLYELISGRDRFICDLRERFFALTGQSPGHCCHPYDVCTSLIAHEYGVAITDDRGQPLDAPLDVHCNLNWAGYANAALREAIEPIVQEWLAAREKASPS